MSDNKRLVPWFVPSLGSILLHAEDEKGSPLTSEEVNQIRDRSVCMMVEAADVARLAEKRGPDLDPENLWYDWQHLRRELDRLPELDPGPKFVSVKSEEPDYQQTIADAQATRAEFRARLPADGSSSADACIKTEVREQGRAAFLWLNHVSQRGDHFLASFFEVPEGFQSVTLDDEIEIPATEVLDWFVNDNGLLHGGYSLRYQRAQLPEEEREAFDEYIGVIRYL